jgi:hypothetical protein
MSEMNRRGVRLTLFGVLVAALAATAYSIFFFETRTRTQRLAARDFDRTAERAMAAVGDVRLAWLAAVAPGQGADYWMPRAAAAIESARADVAALRQRSRTSDATNDLDAAVASLDELRDLHQQVGAQVERDERSAAARTLFADGLDGTGGILQRLDSARQVEFGATEQDVVDGRTNEAIAAAVCGSLVLIIAGLLLPTRATTASSAGTDTITTDEAGLSLRDAVPTRQVTPVPAASEPAASPVARDAAPAVTAQVAHDDANAARERKKAPEVRAAADLCTDFARLVDSQELPGLLERSARLLDASGFIVWLIDGNGQHLRASLAHGYPAQALARMPAIDRGADNATAAAFRQHDVQIVKTNGMSNGAIAVPLLAPQGCIGVIAAEVRHGREGSEMMRQIARLVAAQLSTLVAPAHAAQQEAPLRDVAAR